MAELACVYDAAPVPRAPEDIISTPAQKRRKKKAQAGKPEGREKPREPQARGKWLTASVTEDIPAVIAAAFDEAERRDPQHKREWAVLIDGNNTQIETVTAEAARRGITVTMVIDLCRARNYADTGGRRCRLRCQRPRQPLIRPARRGRHRLRQRTRRAALQEQEPQQRPQRRHQRLG